MWGMRTETIPVIIGALGAIKKGLETYLGRIPGQLSISELQKITLLGTAHILRRVYIKLKTGYPLVPQDHGLISALETLSKHYLRTIIIIIITIFKSQLVLAVFRGRGTQNEGLGCLCLNS